MGGGMLDGFNLDPINGGFEFCGAIVVFLSAEKCRKNKSALGVSYWMTSFFFLWGLWNLPYYISLEQYFSLGGAVLLVLAQVYYTYMIYIGTKYDRKNN